MLNKFKLIFGVYKLRFISLIVFLFFELIIFGILYLNSNLINDIISLDSNDGSVTTNIILSGLLIISYILIKIIVDFFLSKLFYGKALHNLRNKLTKHYLKLPMKYFQKNNAGSVVNVLKRTTEMATSELLNFFKVLGDLILTILLFIVLISIDWKLSLILIGLYFPFQIIIKYFHSRISKISSSVNSFMPGFYNNLDDSFSGRYDIRTNNVLSYFKDRFKNESKFLSIKILHAKTMFLVLNSNFQNIIQRIVPLIAIFIVGFLSDGELDIGKYISFYFLSLLIPSLNSFLSLKDKVKNVLLNWDPILDIMANKSEQNGSHFNDIKKLELVNYSIQAREGWGLKSINLEIKQGERILIIGKTGSGKSLLINTLVGEKYNFANGSFLISGENSTKWDIFKYRGALSYISSKGFVLNDTLMSNLNFESKASKDQVIRLLDDLKIAEIIPIFNDLNLVIDPNTISDGEKVAISFIRAILIKPQVIFLDESTASLTETAENVLLSKVLTDISTIISISHKFSNLDYYNRILFIKEGRVELDLDCESAKNNQQIRKHFEDQIIVRENR